MTATSHDNTYLALLTELVEVMLAERASDLHFSEGYPPIIRVEGLLIPVQKKEILTGVDVQGVLEVLLKEEEVKDFQKNWEADFSYTVVEKQIRFRCNAAIQKGSVSITMRIIPKEIKTFTELNLPPVLETFANKRQGFFLVVGPVGHGKSTTLASMVELINTTRAENIITIEDPIEYIYEPKQCMIHQREVKIDTKSFYAALNSTFRQDVDVILLGEMRGRETISAAVTAAETGHLVFSTLHTNNASQTIHRIIDSFPAEQQEQIRLQLASCLTGIFSQRLVPRIAGGLVPAYELLVNTKAVANMIREDRVHEINTLIETGAEQGMISINTSLAELVRRGIVSMEHAYETTTDPKDLERLL